MKQTCRETCGHHGLRMLRWHLTEGECLFDSSGIGSSSGPFESPLLSYCCCLDVFGRNRAKFGLHNITYQTSCKDRSLTFSTGVCRRSSTVLERRKCPLTTTVREDGHSGWHPSNGMWLWSTDGRLAFEGLRVIHSILALRKRNALPMTDTELKLMAALAIIGLSSKPENG